MIITADGGVRRAREIDSLGGTWRVLRIIWPSTPGDATNCRTIVAHHNDSNHFVASISIYWIHSIGVSLDEKWCGVAVTWVAVT